VFSEECGQRCGRKGIKANLGARGDIKAGFLILQEIFKAK
jgi:hypothetical protein